MIILVPALLLFTPPIVFAVIVVAIWTALDAARRGQNWFAWSVAVAATGVAFPAWLIARRRFEPVAGRRDGAFGAVLVAGILFIVALALLLMWSVTAFLFQYARVEGVAMSPTLNDQDRLIVDKSFYRRQVPSRGDVVMLYYPLNPDKMFVKRVIAEEGDQIRIVAGHVYTNDVPINDGYVPTEHRSHEDYGPHVVPQGYYFVMGDHRNNSSDSRHWGFRATEIHHWQGSVPMVAAAGVGRGALIRSHVPASEGFWFDTKGVADGIMFRNQAGRIVTTSPNQTWNRSANFA